MHSKALHPNGHNVCLFMLQPPSSLGSLTAAAHMQLQCNRLLACARCKLWWMTPSWGTKAGDLPPETQFVLVELAKGGPYAVLLPLIDQDTYRATLRPSTRCSVLNEPLWRSASDLGSQ